MRRVLALFVGIVVGTGLGSGVAHAQGAAAECASVECAPKPGSAAPAVPPAVMQQVWQAAAMLHETKLQFIAAIQRVTQAQAGLFGDERPQLEAAVKAMHGAL